MKLPPAIPDTALPTSLERAPNDKEKRRFAKAATKACAEVTSLVTALGESRGSDAQVNAETAIQKVFGATHAGKAAETLKDMAWILKRWAQKPEEGLSISDTNAFLGWGAGTSVHGTGFFRNWTAAPIKLPRVTKEGVDNLSRTLIHESAHGVSSEIQDAFGYRKMNPGKFYQSTCQQRLINADHYAQCVEIFCGRLSGATWDNELQVHGGASGGSAVASRLGAVFVDLRTICMHAKIAGDRMVIELTGTDAVPLGSNAAHYTRLLGRTFSQATVRGVVRARITDMAHQIRRLEDALAGVDFGDGNVMDIEDLFKEMDIAQKGSAAIVFPINISNVKVMVIASRGTAERDLRGLLLKEMISECLQSHNPGDAGRVITADNLHALHTHYARGAGIPPIDVNLSPAMARHVND
ncbi:hypothetical protein [Pseudoduganella lutea]|uniref:Lysine-specific metallo-endopeptidase domain-containing protein n=1 Tax=Pseudoduganella lutea TaxID=321985 RepID=A0A4P6L0Y8_9BURK|nr:hypothetical protein [Pseudoduganella lutea]QBE64338.1 hypothetical protein EWM63_16170 [Pseudoduganella lutea]